MGFGVLTMIAGQGLRTWVLPAEKLSTVVNTSGAGDTLVAATVYGLLARGWTSDEQVVQAVRVVWQL